ncbi:MAG: copper-containing nitrite reductase [Candidatus Thermoplasmatota archaeon]|jgi:nitrite reductase (NO-forming)
MAEESAKVIAVFGTILAVLVSAALTFVLVGTHDHPELAAKQATRGPRTFEVEMRSIKFTPVDLTIQVGDAVRWTNGDSVGHTVTPVNVDQWGTPGSGDEVARWLKQGETWTHTFTKAGVYPYFCLPHAAKQVDGSYTGMTGTITVTEGSVDASEEQIKSKPGAALPLGVQEIGANASAVPALGPPGDVFVNITSREVVATMADGITYPYWTFDGQVPGRMLRVRVGDTVHVNFTNAPDSTMGHNIDFHAVTGPGGGAAALSALPGESKQLTFKALKPGLFVYHCAYQDPPLHVAHGMYGLILVEPEGGLPPVDREFYVVQGDFYTDFAGSQKGHHEHSETKADDENPTFVVFNGRVGSLRDADRQLRAEVGETVRIYFGVGGPNLVSSFHVIGEIFDRAYQQGDVSTAPAEALQTTLVPAGGATIVDFRLEVPGDYLLVDHSLYRVHKGAAGILHVTGEAEAGVYEASSGESADGH